MFLGGERCPHRRRPPCQDRSGPQDELVDQPSPPGVPGRRASRRTVGRCERSQQFQGRLVAHSFGNSHGGGRVFQVAPCGCVGQQQVVLDDPGQDRCVLAGQPEPLRDHCRDGSAGARVVAGRPFPDVVQERAEQEEIRPADVAKVLGRIGDRFQEVAVHCPAVVGVELRPVADYRPFRQVALPDTELVESFDRVDRGDPTGQQADQCPGDPSGPRVLGRGGLL